MAFHTLLSVFFALFLISHAQIISANGLTFDSGDVVSLGWSYESKGPAMYDLYLCAGDETTDSYVSGMGPISRNDQPLRYTHAGLPNSSGPGGYICTGRLGVFPGEPERGWE
jgi:hypothetical protein